MRRALAALSGLGLDRLLYRVWRYNPVALLRLYGHHAFDRRYGVRTSGYGDLRYEPTPVDAFERTVRALEAVSSRLDTLTFVDIGSGKGKVVLLASTFPFGKVVGVELYPEFHALAVENLERFPEAQRRCGTVELVEIDAARYSIPPEAVALYFFNPFPVEILRAVLDNIEASIRDHPDRPLFVIYYAPILFRETPWDRRVLFDRSSSLEAVRSEKDFTLYRGVSATAEAGSRD